MSSGLASTNQYDDKIMKRGEFASPRLQQGFSLGAVDCDSAWRRIEMHTVTNRLVVGLCIAVTSIAAFAAEKSINRADLPAAVQKTVDAESSNATIQRYVKDKEDGQLEYEVEMIVHGHTKDITIAPDGRLLEIEEQVNLTQLSTAVQTALQSKAAGGTITKVESITKQGQLMGYEAQVKAGMRHKEVQVGPNGSSLAHEI